MDFGPTPGAYPIVAKYLDPSTPEDDKKAIEKKVLLALQECAAQRVITSSKWREDVHAYSEVALEIGLQDAVPALLDLRVRVPPGEIEHAILASLAVLQEPKKLWDFWWKEWMREVPRTFLWPLLAIGLRLSDPPRSLEILQELIENAPGTSHWLGPVLWGFFTSEDLDPEEVTDSLVDLDNVYRLKARASLESVGASSEEIEEWIPLQETSH